MRLNSVVALLCAAVLSGCAGSSALSTFEVGARLSRPPEQFEHVQDEAAEVEAVISLKAPGLRGKAEGIVRHARDGQYLVELYGRGQLFLKVYFTSTQTILWPAAGMPEFFEPDATPMLNAAVHSRLPRWRLDDVLPVPFSGGAVDSSDWRLTERGPMQRIERAECAPLMKEYLRESKDRQFPYRKVVLTNDSGSSRLVWSLREARQE